MTTERRVQDTEGNKSTRQKNFRLKPGYGTIRYIGPGRSRPYAVHPPAERIVENSSIRYKRPAAICYVADWYTGFAVLTAWHAGLYTPGMELELECKMDETGTPADLHQYIQMIQTRCLSSKNNDAIPVPDYNKNVHPCDHPVFWRSSYNITGASENTSAVPLSSSANAAPAATFTGSLSVTSIPAEHGMTAKEWRGMTVKEVYDRYYLYKFGPDAARKLSESTAISTRRISGKLSPIFDREMDSLSVDELQELVNGVRLGRTMVSKTLLLIKELYTYAMSREFCTRNPAQYVRMPDTDDYTHYQDFTDEELKILWRNADDPVVRMILLMCYSGYRISAYETLEINLADKYFCGGVKTRAGKGRIVPIHTGIYEIAAELKASGMPYLVTVNKAWFSKKMGIKLVELGIDIDDRHHTPHSCRHTFSRLCESYGVREADRKRMMGHSFGGDITNGVYSHRSTEELRGEIEKIRIPGSS